MATSVRIPDVNTLCASLVVGKILWANHRQLRLSAMVSVIILNWKKCVVFREMIVA